MMTLKEHARRLLSAIVHRHGYELVPEFLLYDWQKSAHSEPHHGEEVLPAGAGNYLKSDNPRLEELRQRYARFGGDVTIPTKWRDGIVRQEDLKYFRGDNQYLYQLKGRNMSEVSYVLTALYVKSIDEMRLLEKLREDDCFGTCTFDVYGEKISRDLLDSIIEIYFLDRHLHLSSWPDVRILDIGAGYGRLAHRSVEALLNIAAYVCTDAIAESTFLSEYYVRFRNLENRVKVVPLDEIEYALENQSIDIAVNIHSFTECGISAIEWWLSLLEKHAIPYLMIVPDALDNGGELLVTREGHDFGAVIEKHRYSLIAREPKFMETAVHKYAINPTYHYLFQLSR